MSNLYQLTTEVENLHEVLMNSVQMGMVDQETGEIDERIIKALEVKNEEFDKKAIAVATVERRFESFEDEIATEIKRLTALKDNCKKVRERLSNSLEDACLRLGKSKIDGISASISFRKSTKTIVDNENLIPEELFNVTMTKKPNLTKIKELIKAGVEIQGVHLEEKQNIQIK
jgi:thymidylate kinase